LPVPDLDNPVSDTGKPGVNSDYYHFTAAPDQVFVPPVLYGRWCAV
jgi:hypothetical protein